MTPTKRRSKALNSSFDANAAGVIWVLSALSALATVWLLWRGAGRFAWPMFFLSVFFYKWGRNLKRNLRHDQRDDSLPPPMI